MTQPSKINALKKVTLNRQVTSADQRSKVVKPAKQQMKVIPFKPALKVPRKSPIRLIKAEDQPRVPDNAIKMVKPMVPMTPR